MYKKTVFALHALVLGICVILSACARTQVNDLTTEPQSVFSTEFSESQTEKPDSLIADLDIQYSQSTSTVYTVDGIDFVSTTNGIGVVEPGKEIRMLNNQKTAPRLMIIDNVIYYTVVNDVYETPAENVEGEPTSIFFTQCDCWSMNLDGTDQKKLFSYFGNGWVVYRQDNTVFYIDETTFDEFKAEDGDILKLCKIDLVTGKTETITYLYSDSAGNVIWGQMDTDYYTIYKDGCIIITSRSQEVGTYIYNVETNSLQQQYICSLMLANDGTLYAIDYVEVYEEDGSYTYSQHLVKYNIKNNSTEPTGIKFSEQISGGITGVAYGDNGILFGNDTLYMYTPGSTEVMKASDACYSRIYDVFCGADNSYSYIWLQYEDSNETTTHYLTNHVNPETADTVELKDIKGIGKYCEFCYPKIRIGANIVIGYISVAENWENTPHNICCTDYTIVYR